MRWSRRSLVLFSLLSPLALLGAAGCRGGVASGGGQGRAGAEVPRSIELQTAYGSAGGGPATPSTGSATPSAGSATPSASPATPSAGSARLPLVHVADVELPGRPVRFDYMDVDPSSGWLVVAHMNDAAVLFVKLSDGSVLKRLSGIPVPRGVAVAGDVGRVFVTSSPHSLVLIDTRTLTEVGRVQTGKGPDGVAWDPKEQIVGVSDQRDGALSLIAEAGSGSRRAVRLGKETGNVVFDAGRGWFWISVLTGSSTDRLVAVSPLDAEVRASIELPGCESAHGLRLQPQGDRAFIACEGNDTLVEVALAASRVVTALRTGSGPDVLGIDPDLGWLYVAAESGDLTVFDLRPPRLVLVGHHHVGAAAHSLAIDPSSHRIFFPLEAGPKGTPVLRISKPAGI